MSRPFPPFRSVTCFSITQAEFENPVSLATLTSGLLAISDADAGVFLYKSEASILQGPLALGLGALRYASLVALPTTTFPRPLGTTAFLCVHCINK